MTRSPSSRVRIYSHVTHSRFLPIEDPRHIDKLRLFQPPVAAGNTGFPDGTNDPLRYADGIEGSAESPAEQQLFTTNVTPPKNTSALQTFYQQQVAA